MRYLTAGESHGKGLTVILEGFPSNVPVRLREIDAQLKRRQMGYGRGGRMAIESDTATVTAGLFGGKTNGAPIAMYIQNRDHEKWQAFTDPETGDVNAKAVTAVRPGHADHTGCVKYGFDNARWVLERASARETAARVAAGAVCRQLLAQLGVTIASHVQSIGGQYGNVRPLSPEGVNEKADADPVRCLDPEASQRMRAVIDECKKTGDTAGGNVTVLIGGLPAGIGSYVQYDRKLDAVLAMHFMSIQAVKSVSFGMGQAVADTLGKNVHDEMFVNETGGVYRKTNRAGGIEGGMSNGETIVANLSVKPIPTLMCGLNTVDIATHKQVTAHPERSDYCAVPAAGVVAENVAAFAVLDELLKVTGGDDFDTIKRRVEELRQRSAL